MRTQGCSTPATEEQHTSLQDNREERRHALSVGSTQPRAVLAPTTAQSASFKLKTYSNSEVRGRRPIYCNSCYAGLSRVMITTLYISGIPVKDLLWYPLGREGVFAPGGCVCLIYSDMY